MYGRWFELQLLIGALGALAPPLVERSARAEAPRHCVAAARSAALSKAPVAAAAERVIGGPRFVVIPDSTGVGELACAAPRLARDGLAELVAEVQVARGIDPQLVVVLTLDPLSCGTLTYHPFANDVRGIGYRHQDPREVFDDSPDSRLEGIAFLNDLVYWEGHPLEFARAFHHELGHRWSARVHAQVDGAPPDLLLGRTDEHWSYFLDTGGSFLEGNQVEEVGPALHRLYAPLDAGRFSDLDLYLMGVLPASQVAPLSVLTPVSMLAPAVDAARDCFGSPLTRASPPQWCAPLVLHAGTMSVSVDAVIRAEGAREPAAHAAPTTIDLAVLVLRGRDVGVAIPRCDALVQALDARLEEFTRATHGMLRLRNLTAGPATCAELATATQPPSESDGCATSESDASMAGTSCALVALLAAYARISRRLAGARRLRKFP